MKKMLILAAVALCFGCHQEPCTDPFPDTGDFEYFIFGTSYGECGGDCAKIFKLEGSQLFADDGLEYLSTEEVPFQTTGLSFEKRTLAVELSQQLPTDLLTETNGQIGCPDCRDQGTVFIKIKTGGQVQFWFIDPDDAKYAAFCEAVREAVQKMK